MTRKVEPRTLKVISVCSKCGETVGATKDDFAYRHGFNRYVMATISNNKRSQEDGKKCEGSGKPVVFRRYYDRKKK